MISAILRVWQQLEAAETDIVTNNGSARRTVAWNNTLLTQDVSAI